MSLKKRLLGSAPLQAVVAFLIAVYVRLTWRTQRWEVVGAEHLAALDGRPLIACFWHGRMAMVRFLWQRSEPFHVLISHHRDGRLIARAIRHLGVGTITGSSTRAGAQAVRDIVRALKAGQSVGITPDGPRGPAGSAKPGLVAAARLAGAPILPVSYGTTRRRQLRSWDRFLLPLPFGRGVFVIAPPIDATAEDALVQVEQRLQAATDEADRRTGHARA